MSPVFQAARRAAARWLAGLGDLVLPDVCAACGAAEPAAQGLCDRCNVRLLSLVALPYCPRCGTTLGPHVPPDEHGCWACPNPLPRFERVVRLGPYAEPLRALVRELKYRRRDAMRGRLVRLLAEAVRAAGGEGGFDVVLPVPMHWRRRLGRRRDHARALAAGVADALDVPLGAELVRVRNTPPQTHLSRTARLANVRGAFAVRGRAGLRGARVLLVDDVTTTGATANEAARTCLRAAALRVTLAVVAKAEAARNYEAHWPQPGAGPDAPGDGSDKARGPASPGPSSRSGQAGLRGAGDANNSSLSTPGCRQ